MNPTENNETPQPHQTRPSETHPPQVARPRVTVHSMASADGRTDHFAGDVALYYDLAATFPQDAVLAGSGTMVAAAKEQGVVLTDEDPLPGESAVDGPVGDGAAVDGADTRPILVVLDGRGRLTRFDWLRGMPYWRDVLVLCAGSTPAEHLALLDRHRVPYLVTGEERVDLTAALTTLAERYDVRRVRVDSGGSLNGLLLRARLVDEISIVLGPYAVGGRSGRGLFVADDLPGSTADAVTRLELSSVERLRDDFVWLRYRVRHAPETHP